VWDVGVSALGHLEIDGCDAAALARDFQTPLYVVNKQRLRKDYTRFVESFRALYPRVELGYSYKTNPLPGVIRALHEAGALAEVISHFELWLALRLGVPPHRIIFNGPAKTPGALEDAIRRIGCQHRRLARSICWRN
jgi:diaminopimelate decarboxylase